MADIPVVAWHLHDPVSLDAKGRPVFPATVPLKPGLYRLTLPDGRTKVGHGESVSRRISEYRHPTQGNAGEHFINAALREAGRATLETFTDCDLSDKALRLMLERAEQRAADETGRPRLQPHPAWTVRFHARLQKPN